MSAIAGIWRFDGTAAVEDCSRMLASQQIYGPHDRQQWSAGAIAMGRNLFRVLPEDAFDRQPLQTRDGRLTLVADVRLDNRQELAADLGLLEHESAKLCDAAILLECLDRWGDAALDRLVGDFAFALWDAREQTLKLARDFLGQRPLHYHRGKDFFAFASMPKGLHVLSEIPPAPDEQMVAEFLAMLPQSEPRSFFKGISRTERAHVITVTRDRLSSRRYWRQPSPTSRTSAGDYIEGLRHHLDQATRSRLRGTGGAIGTMLSGGLDSAAVTATAARLLAPAGKVVAFTAVPRPGFAGPNPKNRFSDEGPLAAATAAMYPNVEHVLIRAGQTSPLDGLQRSFFLFDSPVPNLCNAVWIDAIHQAARERKLNVVLNGQFGNMTLSYNGVEFLSELLRQGRLIKLCRTAAKIVAKTDMRWRGALVQAFGPLMPDWAWRWLSDTFNDHRWDVLDYTAMPAARVAELNLHETARERGHDLSLRPWKSSFALRSAALRAGERGSFNKGVLAGWGIDRRDPTADRRLVEFCFSIPTEEYIAGGVQRALGRRALSDRLPAAVINERKRGYQAADWYEGLAAARTEVSAELERLTDFAPASRTLDVARMKRLVENMPSAGWERQDVRQRYRVGLLRGISAGHFLRKASGANQ